MRRLRALTEIETMPSQVLTVAALLTTFKLTAGEEGLSYEPTSHKRPNLDLKIKLYSGPRDFAGFLTFEDPALGRHSVGVATDLSNLDAMARDGWCVKPTSGGPENPTVLFVPAAEMRKARAEFLSLREAESSRMRDEAQSPF